MIEQLFASLNPKKIKHEAYTFQTYAILDGVKYPMLWSDLEDGILEYDILFREEALRKKLESVAPFLVKLDLESEAGIEQTKALLRCYGENGCIFLSTPMLFEETLEKMRDIFYLYGEDGEREGILRFYEPLIFTQLLHESSTDIQQEIFAKVYCYWCEDAMGDTLKQYMWDKTHVRYKTLAFDNKGKT